MLVSAICSQLHHGIGQFVNELNAYPAENTLWMPVKGISNSPGNLGLHLVGNINHFIGAALGNTGYVRQRDLEFSSQYIPRNVLIAELTRAAETIKIVLNDLNDNELAKPFPDGFWKEPINIGALLIHLISHLNYHLGQVNYHRRIVGAYS